MKLYKVIIKVYFFGTEYFSLFVLAENEECMKRLVYDYPRYRKADDAEIVSYEEVDLTKGNRII